MPNPTNEHFKIYGLVDPGAGFAIFYVGVTSQTLIRRLQRHRSGASSGEEGPVYEYITHMLKYGIEPQIVELPHYPGQTWGEAERFWIELLWAMGHRLVNESAGGPGTARAVPDEVRAKISAGVKSSLSAQASQHRPDTAQ